MPSELKIRRKLAQRHLSGLLLSAALLAGCEGESHPKDAGNIDAADSGKLQTADAGPSHDAASPPEEDGSINAADSGETQRADGGEDDRDSGPAREPTKSLSCKANAPAAASACRSAPYYLKCDYGGGGSAFCLSTNPTQCEEISGESNCHDQCGDNEYAVACGGVGPNAPQFSEPPGCRGFGRNPGGGSETFCCPCPAP